jgi:CxxC-x17-CxxC domain-containing protein
MEKHHDEQIDCAECGASFVFSADEAAIFAQRGLVAPKRCKSCRRARKERAAGEGARDRHRPFFGAGVSSAPHAAPRAHGNGREAAPWSNGRQPRVGRYTGDVNEYRSPMQDTSSALPYRMAPRPPGGFGAARGNAQPFAGPRAHPHARGPRADLPAAAARTSLPVEPNGKPARRRPAAEMFSITCDACGAQAEVPFKPAEGREVYCPTCYRARRPSA